MACKTVQIHRSTFYYESKESEFVKKLVEELYELAERYPYYGYEKTTQKLNRGAWHVNEKRIQRLRRREGIRVELKPKKRSRGGKSTRRRQRALYPNHVWALDFITDRTEDGRNIKILNIVDEFSRLNVSLEMGRHFRAADVIAALGRAMLEYGIPACLRADNGPEFIAKKLKAWIAESGLGIVYIDPGCPWQNPYVESFHNIMRNECLNRELFMHILEAKVVIEDWRDEYNTERPHGSHGGKTPKEVFREFIPSWRLRLQEGMAKDHRGEYLH